MEHPSQLLSKGEVIQPGPWAALGMGPEKVLDSGMSMETRWPGLGFMCAVELVTMCACNAHGHEGHHARPYRLCPPVGSVHGACHPGRLLLQTYTLCLLSLMRKGPLALAAAGLGVCSGKNLSVVPGAQLCFSILRHGTGENDVLFTEYASCIQQIQGTIAVTVMNCILHLVSYELH